MDEKLTKILSEVFSLPASEINLSMTRDDIDNWDSLKQLDLILSLEKEYNLTLEMADIQKITSFEAIVSILIEKGQRF